MRVITNILTVIFILIALAFLVYGFGFSQYKVYDKPSPEDEGKLSTSVTMTESQLLEEMNYDGIITDEAGNLINKGREASCVT